MRQGQDNITSGFVFFTSQHRASVEVSLFSLATHFYQHLVQLQQQTIRCHNKNKTKRIYILTILIFIPPLLTSCQKHSGVNSPEIEPILWSHDYSVTGCVITHTHIYISHLSVRVHQPVVVVVSVALKKKKKLYHSALFQSLVLINTTQVWCYITGRSLDTKLNLPHHRNLLHLSAKTTTLFL